MHMPRLASAVLAILLSGSASDSRAAEAEPSQPAQPSSEGEAASRLWNLGLEELLQVQAGMISHPRRSGSPMGA